MSIRDPEVRLLTRKQRTIVYTKFSPTRHWKSDTEKASEMSTPEQHVDGGNVRVHVRTNTQTRQTIVIGGPRCVPSRTASVRVSAVAKAQHRCGISAKRHGQGEGACDQHQQATQRHQSHACMWLLCAVA